MSADPVCMRENKAGATSEAFIGKDGGLGNVFVYVKDGLGSYVWDVPTAAVTHGSGWLPISPARVRHPRRTAARDREQRPDTAQRPCGPQEQQGIQQRTAGRGDEVRPHVHCRRK